MRTKRLPPARDWLPSAREKPKLRIRVMADGRIGFPGAVAYQLTDGPNKGERLLCPPTIESHPDPASATPPPLSSAAAARERAKWRGGARASFSYVLVVLDPDLFWELRARGLLHDPRHTGASGEAIDNRVAPGH